MKKKILTPILTSFAKIKIGRQKPTIIAVTGNVGKTSAKEAIASILRGYKKVRVSGGNLNNELGVPMTILGEWAEEYYDKGGTNSFWLKVLFKSFAGLFQKDKNYPEILVMEYGAGKPGDIAKLARDFKPHIGIVTAVGKIPVHVEYFSDSGELAEEKSKLIQVLDSRDLAILNYDDPAVLDMRRRTKAKVLTFGFEEGAQVQVSNFDFRISPEGQPLGVIFKLHYGDSFVPVKIDGALGKSQAWSVAAAAAVGLSLGINLVSISEAFSQYQPPAGRLKILKGIKDSFIVDDTYNASPASTHLALETLKALPANLPAAGRAGRKIIVLGDMLELGQYSVSAHQEVGNFAGSFANFLITVGPGGKIIADAAGNQMPKERIFSFDNSREAGTKVQELIEPGDLVLVKGSQGMRMERIVEEIMADPPAGGENKKELLVRQSKKWLAKD